MDVAAFLNDLRTAGGYAGQIVHVHHVDGRPARFGETAAPLSPPVPAMLRARGIERLYSHQAEAIDRVRAGEDVLIATGTASGKTLCYAAPIIEMLANDPDAAAMLLFPTKALCQDQFIGFESALQAAGLNRVVAGVLDGDAPPSMRRKLCDRGRVIFTNPDMLHASVMPQHTQWASLLARLRLIVIDELHTYSGIFGANVANLLRRLVRACERHRMMAGAPARELQIIACTGTVGNPAELAERVTGRGMAIIDADGSPQGRRAFVFWNPPRVRESEWRARRSANVEAHELMAMLVLRGVPTITFSKAKMTAEMINRYVSEALRATAPTLAEKVSAYRGGYLPEERREIERRLFNGELLGVSTTRALELGVDVGGLEACIIVGYPGTLASFFQQAGRAGRRSADSMAVLIGLDTSVNQYVISHPDYVFGRPIEQAMVDCDNPFVVLGHIRCAAHEFPLEDAEVARFGPHARLAARVLKGNLKLKSIDGRWYHSSAETPQHEVSLRSYSDRTLVIEDADTGQVLGEANKFDALPILHPEAIYMHRGDTYRVLELDLDRNLARVKRVEVDYYTQPLGGTDVHHVDHCLREKRLGIGRAFWGEVTAYFRNWGYEKVHFYSLDAISRHKLDLPTFALETMAVWIVPPEELMLDAARAGLDPHAGLRAIGYATRLLLPLFVTCDTLDLSHSVGSQNSPWHVVFIYERHPHGLGFTERAYELLHRILPAVLDTIRRCPCQDGCPCCVGKPLRQSVTWNVERGEGSVPSKAAARMILERLLGDGTNLDSSDERVLSDTTYEQQLEIALRRRLERMREPQVFHEITPAAEIEHPQAEDESALPETDVSRRVERKLKFDAETRRSILRRLMGNAPADVKKQRESRPSSHVAESKEKLNDGEVRKAKPPMEQSKPGTMDLREMAAHVRKMKRGKRKDEDRG